MPLRKDSEERRAYQSKNAEVSTLIQSKMARVDKKFLEKLKEAGRGPPEKFWRYEWTLTGRPREDPLIKDDATGREPGPIATIQVIEGRVRDMFARSSLKREGENRGDEEELEEMPSKDRITERELKKAIGMVGGTTATGMDGIPMRPVRELRPEIRRILHEKRKPSNERGKSF